MSRRIDSLGFWPPFFLVPSFYSQPAGRGLPILIRIRSTSPDQSWLDALSDERNIADVWSFELVLKNVLTTVGQLMLDGERDDPDGPLFRDVSQWIDQTKSLAGRIPYGGGVREQLMAVAGRVERVRGFPQRYLKEGAVPATPLREFEFRKNLGIWVVDQLLRAFNAGEKYWAKTAPPEGGGEYLTLNRREFWQNQLGRLVPEIPREMFDDHAMEVRIARLHDKIVAGRHDALMAAALREYLDYGPFLADGTLRAMPV